MKQILTLILLMLSCIICRAQETNINEIARLAIADARLNKIDVTPQYTNGKAYLIFYRIKGTEGLYFANIFEGRNTQSYGLVYNLESKTIQETTENYKSDVISFKWSYVNDYDKKEGTATVRLALIYKPAGVDYTLTMVPENLDMLVYKGYVDGSLNLVE